MAQNGANNTATKLQEGTGERIAFVGESDAPGGKAGVKSENKRNETVIQRSEGGGRRSQAEKVTDDGGQGTKSGAVEQEERERIKGPKREGEETERRAKKSLSSDGSAANGTRSNNNNSPLEAREGRSGVARNESELISSAGVKGRKNKAKIAKKTGRRDPEDYDTTLVSPRSKAKDRSGEQSSDSGSAKQRKNKAAKERKAEKDSIRKGNGGRPVHGNFLDGTHHVDYLRKQEQRLKEQTSN